MCSTGRLKVKQYFFAYEENKGETVRARRTPDTPFGVNIIKYCRCKRGKPVSTAPIPTPVYIVIY